MIPAEAVESARVAYLREFDYDENAEYIARLILEAAAPHMLADLRELVEDMEAQPPSEIGSIRGMGGIIRATMKGAL